jgi:DNA-binding response OmpR family regulator
MTEPKNKHVLLVEDNEKILRGNKRLLEWEGYAVSEAMTLREARSQFGEEDTGPDRTGHHAAGWQRA